MVAPIVAVPAAAALAGGGAAALGSLAGGGGGKQTTKRKDIQVRRTYQPTINKNRQITRNTSTTYSPSDNRQVNYNPQVVIDSPNSSIGSKLSQKSKKGGDTAAARGSPRQPVSTMPVNRGGQRTGSQSPVQSGGGDKMVLLGLVAAGAWVLSDG